MNGVSVLAGGTIKVLQMDDIYFVKLQDYEKQEKEIDALKKQLAITERAFKICLNERRNCEIIGRDFMAEAAAEIEKEATDAV